MVDPDNRRPVDFHIREEMLNSAQAPAALLDDWRSGEIKLALLAHLLALRAAEPTLLSCAYIPVESGTEKLFCFAREAEGKILFVAVPRLCAEATIARGLPLPEEMTIGDCSLPGAWRDREWHDALDPQRPLIEFLGNQPLFATFPAFVAISA